MQKFYLNKVETGFPVRKNSSKVQKKSKDQFLRGMHTI